MRLRAAVLILLISILVGTVVYAVLYFSIPMGSPSRGFGGGSLRYAWIPIAILATFAAGMLAYLALFPEIKHEQPNKSSPPQEPQSLEAVKKVLRDDERKVIELLISSGGSMLQRDIARQTGFSRVKTHRILYRLSTRDIITAEKYYNTYRIKLAEWLTTKRNNSIPMQRTGKDN
jgi:hypothetical protein